MSSRKRVRWTGEQMKEAVDAVNGGMKIKPAALKYCVPRKTLSDYVRRGNTDKLRSGPLTVFTQQQERELVGHVKRLQQVGFPVSVTCVR
jgi:transposase